MTVLDVVLDKTLPFDMRWNLVKRQPRVALSKHQIDTFWKEGHLTIPNFVDIAQVDEIDRSFQRLFRTRAGWKEGDFYDIAGLDRGDEFKLPQLLHPAKYAPELLRTVFWANAEAVARTLLGADARFSFDHAISKPPHPESATPWHQDQAFHRAGSHVENITIWLPLQDVDEENGCLTFVPESHKGPMLTHRNYRDDKRIEGLEAVGVDLDKAITVPLRKGRFRSTTAARCTMPGRTGPASRGRSIRSCSRCKRPSRWCPSTIPGTSTSRPPGWSASGPMSSAGPTGRSG
nr:phytanoyl-CoA dioxygenase family protein [Skermanella pratensis]